MAKVLITLEDKDDMVAMAFSSDPVFNGPEGNTPAQNMALTWLTFSALEAGVDGVRKLEATDGEGKVHDFFEEVGK